MPVPAPAIKAEGNDLQKVFKSTYGTWKVDLDAFRSFKIVKGLNKGEKDRAMSLAKEIRLVVEKDSIKATFDQQSTTGTYKIIAYKDDLFTLETKMNKDKVEQIKILFKDGKINLQSPTGSLPLIRN